MKSKMNCSNVQKLLVIILAIVATALASTPAFAQLSGPTATGQICMQKVFGTPVVQANQVGCTAGDIRISRVVSVSPETCLVGTTFDLTATFETDVTANARYDAGFFFRIDGGPNARGDGATATGLCSLSKLDNALDPGLNIDGDTCGDLNAGVVNITFTIPNVSCQDTNGDGFLNLPNCTSWHNNERTACNINSNTDFKPENKSKCFCDDNFQVPVIVETASVTVAKSASPTTVPETGGLVTYTVQITNDAQFVSLTISTIIDDIYGNIGAGSPAGVSANTCPTKIGTVLAPGASTSCSFQATVSGDTGTVVTDVVEVCGTDSAQHNVCGDDDASVTITDSSTAPSLTKTAQSAANCQLDVTYEVVVSNNSTIDTLTVNSLNDDKFGNITTAHAAGGGFAQVVSTQCVTGTVIQPTGNYTCTFVGRIVNNSCNFTHTNTVTGVVTDDDTVQSSPQDTATVTVTTQTQ